MNQNLYLSVRMWFCEVLLFCFFIGAAHAAAPDVCMQEVGGRAGVPILDGEVSGDAGWNNAVQLDLTLPNGSTSPTKLLMGRAAFNGQDSLFVGLVVDGGNGNPITAPIPDSGTTVVLGFSPDPLDASKDVRLHIQPFLNGGAVSGKAWVNSGTNHIAWNAPASTIFSPNWITANLGRTSSSNHWELELIIPIGSFPNVNGIDLANKNTFQIYANIFRTSLTGKPTATVGQDTWPPNTALPNGDITQNTPDPSVAGNWGIVWMNNIPANQCKGVKLELVGVQDPNNASNTINEIRRLKDIDIAEQSIPDCELLADNANPNLNGLLNTFIAKPENTMSTAAKVSVTFRIADWGIPGVDPNAGTGGTPHWQQAKGLFKPLGAPVPKGPPVCDPTIAGSGQCSGVNGNPTSEATIAGGKVGNLQSTWTLNYKQSCYYKFSATTSNQDTVQQGTSHQCIQVDMDSTDPNTRFLNRSVQANMDFVGASTAKRLAIVSGDQGSLPAGSTSHRFLLQVDKDEQGNPYHAPRKPAGWFSGRDVNPKAEKGNGNTATSMSAVSVAGRDGNTKGENGYRRFGDKQLAKLAAEHFGKNVDHLLSWIVRGFLYTGDKIIIDGNAYENVRRVGDFGIMAGHAGSILGWTADFRSTPTSDSSKMTEVVPGSNVYTLEVAPGHLATLETTLVAEEVTIDKSLLEWWQWLLLILIILLLLLLLRRKP